MVLLTKNSDEATKFWYSITNVEKVRSDPTSSNHERILKAAISL